jgi:hypothetical protein
MHQERQRNEQIAATAIPLLDLRRDVFRLQKENDQRDQWCQWVEAARPDDDVLQTLATITVASQTENRAIMIDSLDLRQAIELPSSATKMPDWAIPRIAIEARIRAEAIQPWLDRLNSFDRIDAAAIHAITHSDTSNTLLAESDFSSGNAQPIQVRATPLSTRVLP